MRLKIDREIYIYVGNGDWLATEHGTLVWRSHQIPRGSQYVATKHFPFIFKETSCGSAATVADDFRCRRSSLAQLFFRQAASHYHVSRQSDTQRTMGAVMLITQGHPPNHCTTATQPCRVWSQRHIWLALGCTVPTQMVSCMFLVRRCVVR